MIVSFVIPSFNRADHTQRSLHYLAAQELGAGVELDVHVVDDGSTDHTESVVRDAPLPARYHFRSRDALSCRARARNIGLHASRGAACVFIDSGVLVPPSFARTVAELCQRQPSAVLLHPTLGMYADVDDASAKELDSTPPHALLDWIRRRQVSPRWVDSRQGLFETDLAQHPAPWLLAWTCAVTLPVKLATQVGGFDESFIQWGEEDIEFARRLHAAGAEFAVAHEARAVHTPHAPTERRPVAGQLASNVLRLLQKEHAIAGELLVAISSVQAALFAPRLERLSLRYMLPNYSEEIMRWIRDTSSYSGRRSVAFGLPCRELVNALGVTHVGAHSAASAVALGQAQGGADVVATLGCRTPWPDVHFEAAIWTDALRLFDDRIKLAQLREAARIASRLIVCVTDDRSPLFPDLNRRRECRSIDGWRWSSSDDLAHAFAAAGCTARPIGERQGLQLLEVRGSR